MEFIATLMSFLAGGMSLLDIANNNELSQETRDWFLEHEEQLLGEMQALPEGLPSFQYQGNVFGPAQPMVVSGSGGLTENQVLANIGMTPPPGSGPGIFNLDELFNVGQTELDYFNQFYPTDLKIPGIDIGLGRAMEDISNLLGGTTERIGEAETAALARSATGLTSGLGHLGAAGETIGGLRTGALSDIEQLMSGAQMTPEQLLEGIEMPDTDLSDVLSGRLAGIGATSRTRQELQQQELAAGGAAFGGLENLAGQSRSLGFEEGAQRGLEGSAALAQTRGEELAAQEFVANLQSQASTTSAEINSALSQAGIGAQGLLTSQAMGAETNLGIAKADLEDSFGTADINTINSNIALISGLSDTEARIMLEAEGLELSEAHENAFIQAANNATRLGKFQTGLGLAAGPQRDELAKFATALTGWMTNLGFEAETINSMMNAVLGAGGINQPLMDNLVTDYGSLYDQTLGNVRSGLRPFGSDEPEQKEGFLIGGTGSTCVSGQSQLWTPNGITTMQKVRIGDYVLAADGRFRRVLARDYGYAPREQREQHLRIVLPGQTLEVTEKHPVFGRLAGRWRTGEYLPVVNPRGIRPERIMRIERIPYRVSGDLYLQGNADYIANGFIVNSVIGKFGLRRWMNAVA